MGRQRSLVLGQQMCWSAPAERACERRRRFGGGASKGKAASPSVALRAMDDRRYRLPPHSTQVPFLWQFCASGYQVSSSAGTIIPDDSLNLTRMPVGGVVSEQPTIPLGLTTMQLPPGLSSHEWQPATAPLVEFELAPPVPPLYVGEKINEPFSGSCLDLGYR